MQVLHITAIPASFQLFQYDRVLYFPCCFAIWTKYLAFKWTSFFVGNVAMLPDMACCRSHQKSFCYLEAVCESFIQSGSAPLL